MSSIIDHLLHGDPDPLVADPAASCLVLVDLQYATGDPRTGLGRWLSERGQLETLRWRWDRIADHVVPNSHRLLETFRAAGLQRLYVTYGAEAPDFSDVGPPLHDLCQRTNNRVGQHDHEIIDELAPLPGEVVLNKRTLSAFNSTSIDLVLRTRGVTDLYFCGVSTNACVEGTMRDAADRGYRCYLVEDACGASSKEAHDAGCLNLGGLLGRVVSTAEVLTALGG